MEAKVVETEVQRSTSASTSVSYQLKGDGWTASFSPGGGEFNTITLTINRLGPGDAYRYERPVSFNLNEAIELAKKIPEVVRAVLPLLMLNNESHYATKRESVELHQLNGSGAMRASILPAIEARNGQ